MVSPLPSVCMPFILVGFKGLRGDSLEACIHCGATALCKWLWIVWWRGASALHIKHLYLVHYGLFHCLYWLHVSFFFVAYMCLHVLYCVHACCIAYYLWMSHLFGCTSSCRVHPLHSGWQHSSLPVLAHCSCGGLPTPPRPNCKRSYLLLLGGYLLKLI